MCCSTVPGGLCPHVMWCLSHSPNHASRLAVDALTAAIGHGAEQPIDSSADHGNVSLCVALRRERRLPGIPRSDRRHSACKQRVWRIGRGPAASIWARSPPPHPSSAATIGAPWREGACSACPLGKCSAAAAPPSGGSSMHANLRHSDHSDRCDWQRASGSASLEFAGSCRSGSDPAVIGAIP